MMSTTRVLLVLSAGLLVGACSSEQQAGGTDDLTRNLLEQPAGDGLSTPIAADPAAGGQESPRVPVSEVGFNRGDSLAPVKVVELSDYGCGYCRQFHEQTFPALVEEFIDSGMVEWKFVPYITGMFDNSLAVLEAAECTLAQGDAPFERLNSRLWSEQSVWKGSAAPEDVVREWVTELGIDLDAFDSCVADDERIDRIAAATTLARQVGVRGTPTFIVIGYPPLQGALPLETFQEILRAVHSEAQARASGQQ